MSVIRIGIIIGSTRPGRVGARVAEWVRSTAAAHTDEAQFDLIDLLDFSLPHYDEPIPASQGRYQHEHTLAWADKIAGYDGFIFVTPEYNHSISGALKNAIDYLYAEWNDKAAAIVSYGGVGGARAAEHLRLILGEIQIADVRQQLAFSMLHDFEGWTELRASDAHVAQAGVMVDQLVAWAGALRAVREAKAELAAA
jgi:NAD(P)H-dependent FMN reductase